MKGEGLWGEDAIGDFGCGLSATLSLTLPPIPTQVALYLTEAEEADAAEARGRVARRGVREEVAEKSVRMTFYVCHGRLGPGLGLGLGLELGLKARAKS